MNTITIKIEKYSRDNDWIRVSYYVDVDKMQLRMQIISSDTYDPVIDLSCTKKKEENFKTWLKKANFKLVSSCKSSCKYIRDFDYD